jgi:multicomponent Na+:H+ antiporter subunit G
MNWLIDLLSWTCFLAGGFFCISGSVGLHRLPDFFSRIHSASVTDTLAAPLLLLGVILQAELSLDSIKIFLVMGFLLATNPTATHAMVKAALLNGQYPEVGEPNDQTEEDESCQL